MTHVHPPPQFGCLRSWDRICCWIPGSFCAAVSVLADCWCQSLCVCLGPPPPYPPPQVARGVSRTDGICNPSCDSRVYPLGGLHQVGRAKPLSIQEVEMESDGCFHSLPQAPWWFQWIHYNDNHTNIYYYYLIIVPPISSFRLTPFVLYSLLLFVCLLHFLLCLHPFLPCIHLSRKYCIPLDFYQPLFPTFSHPPSLAWYFLSGPPKFIFKFLFHLSPSLPLSLSV